MFIAVGFNQLDIVKDGLVMLLDANDKSSYRGTGTVWTDLSKGGNNGTLTNGPTFSSTNGGAIVFNGSNNYINCGTNLSFTTTGFSICAWVYPTSATSYRTVFNKGDGTSAAGSQYELMASFAGSNKFQFDVFIGGARTDTVSPSTYTLNRWHYVCGTRSGSLNTLYENGASTKTVTIAGTLNTTANTTKIGIAGATLPFAGNIAVAQIYNRALTAAEVLQNYASAKSRFGL